MVVIFEVFPESEAQHYKKLYTFVVYTSILEFSTYAKCNTASDGSLAMAYQVKCCSFRDPSFFPCWMSLSNVPLYNLEFYVSLVSFILCCLSWRWPKYWNEQNTSQMVWSQVSHLSNGLNWWITSEWNFFFRWTIWFSVNWKIDSNFGPKLVESYVIAAITFACIFWCKVAQWVIVV